MQTNNEQEAVTKVVLPQLNFQTRNLQNHTAVTTKWRENKSVSMFAKPNVMRSPNNSGQVSQLKDYIDGYENPGPSKNCSVPQLNKISSRKKFKILSAGASDNKIQSDAPPQIVFQNIQINYNNYISKPNMINPD